MLNLSDADLIWDTDAQNSMDFGEPVVALRAHETTGFVWITLQSGTEVLVRLESTGTLLRCTQMDDGTIHVWEHTDAEPE